MTNYKYSELNRIKFPNDYKYSSFEGFNFIDSYFKDRTERLKDLFLYENLNFNLNEKNLDFVIKNIMNERSKDSFFEISYFSIEKEIVLSDLIDSILNNFRKGFSNNNEKWLSLILQRFEVNNKLYQKYKPGFRKGFLESNQVSLYIDFALCLNLAYLENKNIQYLSTHLKIMDLLLSLDKNQLLIGKEYLIIKLVECELNFIRILCKDNYLGKNYD